MLTIKAERQDLMSICSGGEETVVFRLILRHRTGQLADVSCPFLPCGSLVLNSGCHIWGRLLNPLSHLVTPPFINYFLMHLFK